MKLKSYKFFYDFKALSTILHLLVLLGCMLVSSLSWAQSPLSWTSIGPAGGSVTSLLADPAAPTSALYAGSVANGIFHSNNAGVTWSSVNGGLPSGSQIYSMVSLGNLIIVATDSGVYASPAGLVSNWKLVPAPTAPVPISTIKLLASVNSILYMAEPDSSNVYWLSVVGLDSVITNPIWNSVSLPVLTIDPLQAQHVRSLGILGNDIAVGSDSVIFIPDHKSGFTWVDSESGAVSVSGFNSEPIAAIVSASSTLAFACTLPGNVFQADTTVVPLAWQPASSGSLGSCNGLTVAQVNSSGLAVLAISTNTGAYISTAFDNATLPTSLTLIKSPDFPMTAMVNAAILLNPADRSSLLWATDFGVNSTNSDSANMSTVSVRNGPVTLATPSQRLDNVNVKDVAILGSSMFAIAQSLSDTYMDVMVSNDSGLSWSTTNLNLVPNIKNIKVLAVDPVRNILFAGTDIGVFSYQNKAWTLILGAYDVNTLALGSQYLYVGGDAGQGQGLTGLLALNLTGTTSGLPVALPLDVGVRALVVTSGSVYVAGVIKDAAGTYANYVYRSADVAISSYSWNQFGNTNSQLPTNAALSRLAVGAGKVFAAGDGFLFQCESETASWGPVSGLPKTLTGEFETVSALVSDGAVLYVGTVHGLLALNLSDSMHKDLVPISGTGASAMSSLAVNGLRVLAGRLYVATAAGISTPTSVAAVNVGGASSGGGCSMAIAGDPDPLLWLLVALAALQIAYARKRRVRNAKAVVSLQHQSDKGHL